MPIQVFPPVGALALTLAALLPASAFSAVLVSQAPGRRWSVILDECYGQVCRTEMLSAWPKQYGQHLQWWGTSADGWDSWCGCSTRPLRRRRRF